jgi:hypothetical protein
MKIRFLFLVFAALFVARGASAQANTCQVPDKMSKDQKIPCVRAGSFMLDQPTLTPAQLSNGPDFDAANPDASRYLYFTNDDNIFCYFRPHYAFMSVPGDSKKFQCWHMTSDGGFITTKGETVRQDAVKVVIKNDKDGEKTANLYAANDANNEQPIKADHFKIKYLSPAFPDHNTRFNEVFTEVAASRIMWVLGFPADHVYPVGSASCIGCTADPFEAKLKGNSASLKDTPTVFKVISAERETPWDQIKPGGDETWSWSDAAKFYSDGEFSHQQRVEYDAYRLALGLFHYHNAISQQNRLACAQWAPDAPGQAKVCQKPMIFVQDLGSTFGKAKGPLDIGGTNPRGSFSAWEDQTVFSDLNSCQLRATMDGDKQVLKEAQDLMIQRIARLDPQTVKTIFTVARFDKMDQKQIRKLKDAGSKNPEADALDQWTNTLLKRLDEIRNAKNCKAN